MTGFDQSLTARICARIVAASQVPLDPFLLQRGKQLFLDGVAVGVAGARIEEAPRILAEYFSDPLAGGGGKTGSSLLGLGRKLPAVQAALVNGAAMHVLDFEPMWLPATHALSPALAPVLALGEALGSDGAACLRAMIFGIEIQGWLRQAAGSLESHELRFHPPGFVGPIGAAVAAGILLGFDAAQLANAIGIASSRCGGLFTNLGTMTKATHTAYAASLGLEAALLTRRGFSGCMTTFDPAPQSYGDAFFPKGFDAEALLSFGQPFRIVDPGYAIKIFPAKFSTHYAITAALDAKRQIVATDAIRSIKITAADVPSSNRPNPRSGLDGKFSLQYTAAAALLDGHVGLSSFTDERLARADMQALLPKFSVHLTRDIPSKYTSGRHLVMEIGLASGETVLTRCDRPRGSWGSEPIGDEEHLAKVRDCLATMLSPADVSACIELAQSIDQLDASGVQRLLDLARGPMVKC
ncbi:MmgE/PrpD family protein [Acidisphaera sp. L21]|jgi:2-methylcitrate dehydratase PrpD|uniref:MmgE/PrpD family protein n=1 Tax=Acidisphaera sp. L21 TaxID=1641851 RepID=UPI00131AA860|nr:MmgE/PrpD family protein [Acidisphaera sp. L21]